MHARGKGARARRGHAHLHSNRLALLAALAALTTFAALGLEARQHIRRLVSVDGAVRWNVAVALVVC